MLVIHPADRTTSGLFALYQGENVTVVDQRASNKEVARSLRLCPKHERIMLLGHGSENGLFSREDDTVPEFDRIIVGHPHAYHLRKHGCNLIGIWCHADKFALKEGLHGLFSGMIISDIEEAESYGIPTLQQQIEAWNESMFTRLRQLLDEECPLHEIPERLKVLDDQHSLLTDFNYNNFYYL